MPAKGLIRIVGNNKEELLKIIAGVNKSTSGEVIMDEEPLNYNDAKKLSEYKANTVSYLTNDYLIKSKYKNQITSAILNNLKIIIVNIDNISN